MGKKVTKAATPAPAKTEAQDKMAKVRAARGSGDGDKDVFTFVPEKKRTEEQQKAKKLAPQAMVIVNGVEAAGTCTREELIKSITGVLVTRQPVGRIVTYYQKAIVDSGHITITKATPAVAPTAK